jgi:hypothetical protein
MVLAYTISKNGVKIRLTKERWVHILTSHLEFSGDDLKFILQVISRPDMILKGDKDELLAVKNLTKGSGLWYHTKK